MPKENLAWFIIFLALFTPAAMFSSAYTLLSDSSRNLRRDGILAIGIGMVSLSLFALNVKFRTEHNVLDALLMKVSFIEIPAFIPKGDSYHDYGNFLGWGLISFGLVSLVSGTIFRHTLKQKDSE